MWAQRVFSWGWEGEFDNSRMEDELEDDVSTFFLMLIFLLFIVYGAVFVIVAVFGFFTVIYSVDAVEFIFLKRVSQTGA